MSTFHLVAVFFDFPLQLNLADFSNRESCEAVLAKSETELAVPRDGVRLICFEIDANGRVVKRP